MPGGFARCRSAFTACPRAWARSTDPEDLPDSSDGMYLPWANSTGENPCLALVCLREYRQGRPTQQIFGLVPRKSPGQI